MDNLFYEFRLTDTPCGDVLFMRVVPKDGDPWGFFRCLEGTSWWDLISVVDPQVFQTALLGHILPLMREIGTPPEGLCRKIPLDEGVCKQHTICPIYNPRDCKPSPKLPLCYEPPLLEGDALYAATMIALAWKEGRYVIVVNDEQE